jgi:alpha-galactosidase
VSTRDRARGTIVCISLCLSLALILISTAAVEALDNGLALTPPMGWNSWNAFRGEIDEVKIRQIAEAMVSSGMKDAGYEYIILDDNWMANPARDADGNLIADPRRFPSGIKALADYIHSLGLKIGIYGDRGTATCMNIPQSGSYGYEEQDARTFAEWGIDYLKYDNCNTVGNCISCDYKRMQEALADCGRPIVYSICAWGFQAWMPEVGNLWRTTGDIVDKWDNGSDWFVGIINAIDLNMRYARYAKPGAWNDPDMFVIGNGGCTVEEYKTQFSMWCMMASPLIAGNDLRNMDETTRQILTNKELIAVNQDPLGIQCTKIRDDGDEEVYVKPLSNGDYAVALLNRGEEEALIRVTAAEIGFASRPGYGYLARDLWQHSEFGTADAIEAVVPVHGTAVFRVSQVPVEQLPGHVAFAVETDTVVSAEAGFKFTVHLSNTGLKDVEDTAVTLRLPEGWEAEALTANRFSHLDVGEEAAAVWRIMPPPHAEGFNVVGVMVTYSDSAGARSWSKDVRLVVLPPEGSVYLSDLKPLSTRNGWGPVEFDQSNGETAADDGRVITIGGVQYNKGLGVHAHSEVVYDIGGSFATFAADVGVDDEVGSRGSVVFQVWGDNVKLWESQRLDGSMGPQPVTVDISGVRMLKLVVTDGGDGNAYDHADWAGARLLPRQ